jgi:hypothetical protein
MPLRTSFRTRQSRSRCAVERAAPLRFDGMTGNTDKTVAGVKGTLDVNDLFGDELSGFAVSNDTTIASGATITWTGGRSVKFSMNSNKDEKLAGLANDKYKVIWNPKMIIFGDGTKVSHGS